MSKKDLNQKQNVRFVVEEIEYTLDRVQGGTIFLGVISKFHWFFRVHWQSCRLHVLPGPHPEASWVRCLCISRIPLVLRTSSFSSWAPLLCDSITGATSVCVCVCVWASVWAIDHEAFIIAFHDFAVLYARSFTLGGDTNRESFCGKDCWRWVGVVGAGHWTSSVCHVPCAICHVFGLPGTGVDTFTTSTHRHIHKDIRVRPRIWLCPSSSIHSHLENRLAPRSSLLAPRIRVPHSNFQYFLCVLPVVITHFLPFASTSTWTYRSTSTSASAYPLPLALDW